MRELPSAVARVLRRSGEVARLRRERDGPPLDACRRHALLPARQALPGRAGLRAARSAAAEGHQRSDLLHGGARQQWIARQHRQGHRRDLGPREGRSTVQVTVAPQRGAPAALHARRALRDAGHRRAALGSIPRASRGRRADQARRRRRSPTTAAPAATRINAISRRPPRRGSVRTSARRQKE